MQNIIKKTYVINLPSRKDRWESVQKNFRPTGLYLNRWNATYGKNLSEEDIIKKTTQLCNTICNPAVIGTWLSHYSIWKQIVTNKETNVLILEDDAVPTDNFWDVMGQTRKELPEDYDLLLLTCLGSCDRSRLTDRGYEWLGNYKDERVFIDGKEAQHIFRPRFPLCSQAYMLSYRGAKKLLEHPMLKKVRYHLDYTLSYYVFSNPSYKMYALKKPVVKHPFGQVDSDIQSYHHPLINHFGAKVQVADEHNLASWSGIQMFSIRQIGLDVTAYLLAMIILSFILGILAPNRVYAGYLALIIVFYLVELVLIKKMDFGTVKTIAWEAGAIFVFLRLGRYLGCNVMECTL